MARNDRQLFAAQSEEVTPSRLESAVGENLRHLLRNPKRIEVHYECESVRVAPQNLDSIGAAEASGHSISRDWRVHALLAALLESVYALQAKQSSDQHHREQLASISESHSCVSASPGDNNRGELNNQGSNLNSH